MVYFAMTYWREEEGAQKMWGGGGGWGVVVEEGVLWTGDCLGLACIYSSNLRGCIII